MKKLEDYLRRDAERYPEKIAVTCHGQSCTYSKLLERVEERAAQLMASDTPVKGRLLLFRASQTIDFLVEYFAIHWVDAVAVPVEKDLPDASFRQLRQELASYDRMLEGTADVLFTTGTTGKSKGVMISHDTILADAENLIEAQGYHHDLTFIINGPLNHIGSLSKVYPVIMQGASLHILEGMKDLNAFFQVMAHSYGPVGTFLVPASIRMLLAFAEERLARMAEKIEFIETGAAPIALADMQRLCHVLPHARLFNTYASTETGIIATHDFNHDGCVAGCLGRPMRHSSLEIDEGGRIACSGRTLMMGYLGNQALTRSVLHEGKLLTSDLGHLDDEGRLHLTGRIGDVINVGGYKVIPTEVENAALAIPGIKDCVCIAAQHRVLGTVLKLLVVLYEGYEWNKRSLAKQLSEKMEAYKVPMLYEQVDVIKRTFNHKIDRKAYLQSE